MAFAAFRADGTSRGVLSVVAGRRVRSDLRAGPAPKASLWDPGEPAVDAHGDLFIADSGDNVVEEVTPSGWLSVVAGDGKIGPPKPGLATRSALDSPTGVAVDTHGNLFIAD